MQLHLADGAIPRSLAKIDSQNNHRFIIRQIQRIAAAAAAATMQI